MDRTVFIGAPNTGLILTIYFSRLRICFSRSMWIESFRPKIYDVDAMKEYSAGITYVALILSVEQIKQNNRRIVSLTIIKIRACKTRHIRRRYRINDCYRNSMTFQMKISTTKKNIFWCVRKAGKASLNLEYHTEPKHMRTTTESLKHIRTGKLWSQQEKLLWRWEQPKKKKNIFDKYSDGWHVVSGPGGSPARKIFLRTKDARVHTGNRKTEQACSNEPHDAGKCCFDRRRSDQ